MQSDLCCCRLGRNWFLTLAPSSASWPFRLFSRSPSSVRGLPYSTSANLGILNTPFICIFSTVWPQNWALFYSPPFISSNILRRKLLYLVTHLSTAAHLLPCYVTLWSWGVPSERKRVRMAYILAAPFWRHVINNHISYPWNADPPHSD